MVSSESQAMPGPAAVRRACNKSFTAMSAAVTGDPWPLVQVSTAVPNMESASAPASRTAAVKISASAARSPASLSGNGQSFDPHRRRVGAVAKDEIGGRFEVGEYVAEIPGDGDLAHRE